MALLLGDTNHSKHQGWQRPLQGKEPECAPSVVAETKCQPRDSSQPFALVQVPAMSPSPSDSGASRALLGTLPTFLTLDPHEALGTEANKRAWEIPAGPAVLAGL